MVRSICFMFAVVGLLSAVAGQSFPTETQYATAYNQGRHLALDPVTGWLHLVFAYGETDDSPIHYSYSTDQGSTWSPVEVVGEGREPCIVCEGGQPWVSYWKWAPQKLFTAARLASGIWQAFEVCKDNVFTPPSMAVCHKPPVASTGPAVCVAYGWFDPEWSYHIIRLHTVTLSSGPVEPPDAAWAAPADAHLWEPSVAVTGGERGPGEYVHVSWCEQLPPQFDRQLWYRMRIAPGWWDGQWEVSQARPDLYKPAFNPSIESFAESVYVVWRSKEQGDDGMIWRAQRYVEDPPSVWFPIQPVLDAATEYANCPQQSTPWAHAWHQRADVTVDEDIWLNLFMLPPTFPLQVDEPQSLYPNIAAEVSTLPEEYLVLHTAWTSEAAPGSPTPYEVLFRRDVFTPPPHDGFRGFVYYDVQAGDSVRSRYCLARDGFRRWRGHSVDYGREGLKYRLWYLNPNYDYRVEAVLYQASQDTWEQSFSLDSVQVARVRFEPGVLETVLVYIPREKYVGDSRVDLDITRLVGDYAVLAELKLYQCYPYKRKSDDGSRDAVLADRCVQPVELVELGPAIIGAATRIDYAVSQPGYVDVGVYDALGRVVRRVATGFRGRGTYSATWNGLDANGRAVRPGAYLLRVESSGFSQTRKVVLTR